MQLENYSKQYYNIDNVIKDLQLVDKDKEVDIEVQKSLVKDLEARIA